jgi:hypothetical protein
MLMPTGRRRVHRIEMLLFRLERLVEYLHAVDTDVGVRPGSQPGLRFTTAAKGAGRRRAGCLFLGFEHLLDGDIDQVQCAPRDLLVLLLPDEKVSRDAGGYGVMKILLIHGPLPCIREDSKNLG